MSVASVAQAVVEATGTNVNFLQFKSAVTICNFFMSLNFGKSQIKSGAMPLSHMFDNATFL